MEKNKFSSIMSCHLALLSSVAVLSLGVSGSAMAAVTGIANTKHNLSSSQTNAGFNKTSTTAQICVFCHTPHGANTDKPGPLWNRNVGDGSAFTVYQSATMEATSALVATSPSLVCLSCHDGVQAMDSVINSPGSGLGTGTMGPGSNWSGSRNTNGVLNGNTVANLGTDLSNDHPIGIAYCGGGLSTVTGLGTCADADFNSITVGAGPTFWVEAKNSTLGSATAAGRQKGDLPLYVANSKVSVECGSCHDPHVEDSVEASGLNFMRATTAGSAICLSCHNK